MKHIPRKRFGQHFLTDRSIIEDIVQAIAPQAGQPMVEIGPGLAAMTQPLVERLGHLTVIELDRDLAKQLRAHPRLTVIESDVLKVDFRALAASIREKSTHSEDSRPPEVGSVEPLSSSVGAAGLASACPEPVEGPDRRRSAPSGGSEPPEVGSVEPLSSSVGAAGLALPDRRRSAPSGGSEPHEVGERGGSIPSVGAHKLRVVGNLPYNISTPILFHLLDAVNVIEDQHFMLQKEVIDRMVAAPSTSAYGRLSVMLQWRYAMANVLHVPPQSFDPPPRVDSAIVRMVPHAAPAALDVNLLSELVRVAFSQRRKLLRHSLGQWLTARGFPGVFDTQRRAEEVPVAEYIALAQQVAQTSA